MGELTTAPTANILLIGVEWLIPSWRHYAELPTARTLCAYFVH